MREFFNEAGKIYILTSVSLIVLVGFGLYLLSISKKVSKIEEDYNQRLK